MRRLSPISSAPHSAHSRLAGAWAMRGVLPGVIPVALVHRKCSAKMLAKDNGLWYRCQSFVRLPLHARAQQMKTRLLLHCAFVDAAFTLAKEGEDWRYTFSRLEEALNYASEIITEETPITIYNEIGEVMVESFVKRARTESLSLSST